MIKNIIKKTCDYEVIEGTTLGEVTRMTVVAVMVTGVVVTLLASTVKLVIELL